MVLPEISGILGIYQLRRLDEFIARRNQIAAVYDAAFSKIGSLQTVKCPPGWKSAYYKYPLILGDKINKAEFTRQLLQDYGIETGNVFYPPCHLQEVYQKLGVISYGSLLTAEQVLARTITLPMHVGLTNEDVEYVVDKVTKLA
jgi:UDP-4-amino-4,6-dideoxy-L-N-acetyl-beta-L-altrosamine transaminase